MRKMLLQCGFLMLLAGCAEPGTSQYEFAPGTQPLAFTPTSAIANPLFVPVVDPQCVSEMTAEVVDDYFQIATEEPVRWVGNSSLPGKIETFPEVSPTLLEPWRKDIATFDQRLENTLQTYRRRAVVRILPGENGHWIDVAVFLELEDMPQPEHSSAGAATFRYDSTLNRVENPIGDEVAPKGWISKGRDAALEQIILGHLQYRALEMKGK